MGADRKELRTARLRLRFLASMVTRSRIYQFISIQQGRLRRLNNLKTGKTKPRLGHLAHYTKRMAFVELRKVPLMLKKEPRIETPRWWKISQENDKQPKTKKASMMELKETSCSQAVPMDTEIEITKRLKRPIKKKRTMRITPQTCRSRKKIIAKGTMQTS